jgi:uncharacterized protein GlcG (DUF336 family)
MTSHSAVCAMVCLVAMSVSMAAEPPKSAPAPAPVAEKAVPSPPAALALEAVQAAIAACHANGYNEVAASVIDSGGELKVMMAADGTPPGHAVPRSAMKAVTALSYRMSSAAVQAKTQTDKAFAAEVEGNPKLVARAGGELLFSHGQIIGAMGVSGAPGGDKDDVCTQAGIDRIKARL